MTTFREFLKEQLQDEHFRREYEGTEFEWNIIQQLIDAQNVSEQTREELSAQAV
ncbi:MAG: hypothetical protein IJ587_08715 [Synergistaceae bacterium]|nr:hypothetical protein [Synergistaceae bacterium]